MLGPENELPSRRAARSKGGLVSQLYETDDGVMSGDPSAAADEAPSAPPGGFSPTYSEALSLFPRPKELLSRVIQVATSSNMPKVSQRLLRLPWGGRSFVAFFFCCVFFYRLV